MVLLPSFVLQLCVPFLQPSDLVSQYRDLMYKDSMARVDTASAFIELVESFRYVGQDSIREILDDPDNTYSV